MSAMQLNKCTRSYSLSFAVVSVASALLVVVKELNEGVMGLMKKVTVHHWVTHAVFDVALFFLLAMALGRMHDGQGPQISDENTLKAVVGATAIGLVIILAFYGVFD
jgi:hypothetical protein